MTTEAITAEYARKIANESRGNEEHISYINGTIVLAAKKKKYQVEIPQRYFSSKEIYDMFREAGYEIYSRSHHDMMAVEPMCVVSWKTEILPLKEE